MNIYHRKAIEMKYQGYSYKEISDAIGKRISEKALQNYFSVEGKLYVPYLEYESEHNKYREEQTKRDFQRQASYAAKIMNSLLQKALKNGNDKLAFEILKEQLDRAGITSPPKPQPKVAPENERKPRFETIQDYCDHLEERNIDWLTFKSLDEIRALPLEEKEALMRKVCAHWFRNTPRDKNEPNQFILR